MIFPVTPAKQLELLAAMRRLGIREEDLEERFDLSSGRGGQKRNKTSNAVSLWHRPSGLRVRCEKTRSQAMNRFLARRMLVEKLTGGTEAGRLERERVRRRLRKRKERSRRRVKRRQAAEDAPQGQK